MTTALQRRARGGLCAVVLVAALGGFAGIAQPVAHGRSAPHAQLVRAHLAAVPATQFLARGAQQPIGFDAVGAQLTAAPVVRADAAALPAPSAVTDADLHITGGRGPPAGELA
jgi:hypothetical protein